MSDLGPFKSSPRGRGLSRPPTSRNPRWKSPGSVKHLERRTASLSINNTPREMSATVPKHQYPHSSGVKNQPQPALSTSYKCSELLETLKSIQQAVQCCLCHKLLQSARSCASGHGICLTCKNRCSSVCPLCNTLIADNKPILLNSIIKLLPRKCNFNENGCDCLVLAKDMDHETFCRFRKVICRFPSCNSTCLAKDLLRHLEDFHGREIIRNEIHSQILMNFDARIEKDGFAAIVAFNNIIWQHTRVGNNSVLQFYQYVPMEKPIERFWVVVNFYTPENSFSRKTPIHTDLFDPQQLFKDKETFCLPQQVASAFRGFYGGVKNEFKIIKEDS